MKVKKKEVLPENFEVKNLIDCSWQSLQSLFKEVVGRPITKEELPKWKLVLGFVNATNNSVKTSMQCYRFLTLPLEIKAVKKVLKRK